MALVWRDSFSCNVEEIDNQHKKLFEIGSRLHAAAPLCIKNDQLDEIKEIIRGLKDYTVYHFSYEEKLMLEYEYSDYMEQKLQHEEFIKKLLKFEQEDLNLQQIVSVMNLIAFVTDWISSHILQTDMKFKDFFNSKGVK